MSMKRTRRPESQEASDVVERPVVNYRSMADRLDQGIGWRSNEVAIHGNQ
jgi:hypothetical protein